jgi:hypothetical protein
MSDEASPGRRPERLTVRGDKHVRETPGGRSARGADRRCGIEAGQ